MGEIVKKKKQKFDQFKSLGNNNNSVFWNTTTMHYAGL
jgi:hypothetical protein